MHGDENVGVDVEETFAVSLSLSRLNLIDLLRRPARSCSQKSKKVVL